MGCGSALERPPEERRRVTVVFADLSGYTAVAERMDPEAVKSLVGTCMRRLADEIVAVGGTIDKFIGDNVMAVFGAPVAHEDDAERAVRAALAMQAAMPQLNTDLGAGFALRVGVNTGEVMAGAVGESYTVIGDPVNVAARLQAAGRPGTVTVGARTWLATRDVIEYSPLEPLTLKGKAEPVPAWEAVRVLATRPERAARPGRAAPLVGRTEELARLAALYDRVARERRPHLATVIGEAGVGKSRLLQELSTRLRRAEPPAALRQGRCLPYGSGIVYWALGEVVRAACAITDDDASEVAWEKLAAATDRAAPIARLLGIEPPAAETAAIVDDDPERLREASFSAVRAFVETMTTRGPVVLAFEDIHWADSGLLDLIEYLAEWVHGPLLLLCLARDELLDRRRDWGAGSREASTIALEPLDAAQARGLVLALLQDREPSGQLGAAIAERSGGNPFFAEELVRRLMEEGVNTSVLPDSVQGVLAARLDALDPFERQLVQHAAVVGRTFWPSSLEGVAERAGRDLAPALASLIDKEILAPGDGAQPAGERELAFRHVLIRDVAYGTLPKSVRCRRHLEVAELLERRAGDRGDELVAVLAEHYERATTLGDEIGLDAGELAGIRARAVPVLEAAGDTAAAVFSNQEAFRHYERARALSGGEDPDLLAGLRSKQGDVAMRLGRVATAIELWEPALERHVARGESAAAGDLHRRLGSAFWHLGETRRAIEHYQHGINLLKEGPPHLALVALYEEAAELYMNTGDNMLAIYAAEKALRLAEQLSETRAAARAHGIFGRVFGRIGDADRARQNLERGVELARESDPAETIRALLALGSHLEIAEADYGAAADAYSEALALAQRLGDAPAQVELQAALGVLAAYRADWDAVREFADSSGGLAEREGLVGKLAYPAALRGFLSLRAGELAEAQAHFEQAHELAVRVGWSEVAFWALFGLAVARRDRGDTTGAVAALDLGLEVCERAGLGVQAVQAVSLRAVTLALAGRSAEAQASARDAADRGERLRFPITDAAVLEARGATAVDAQERLALLREARDKWAGLGRPLDAARCESVAVAVASA
jgi:class 3 adenylate cyclase/tetratricopeptide (TPR) repeat protein